MEVVDVAEAVAEAVVVVVISHPPEFHMRYGLNLPQKSKPL
jgi:hypothetical protein